MVAPRRFVVALILATLSWRGGQSLGDEIEPLPPVRQEPPVTEVPSVAEGETSAPVPWEPGTTLEVIEEEKKGKFPAWGAVRVEALLLWRDAPQSVPLVDFAGGGRALDARDLHSGMAAGPRFTLLSEGTGGGGSQVGYFDVSSFQASRGLPTIDGGYQTVPGLDGAPSLPIDNASAGLSSRIKSLEVINRQRVSERWVRTDGFRWVEWQETFSLLAGPQAFGVRAIDSLYGQQWGIEGVLWRPTASVALEAVGKAGIYGNVSKQDSFLEGPGGRSGIATNTARVAFVGETGLTGTWQMREWLRARAGYQAIWLGGIATAPNQLAGQSIIAGAPQRGSTHTGGSVVLQGIDLGLEAHW